MLPVDLVTVALNFSTSSVPVDNIAFNKKTRCTQIKLLDEGVDQYFGITCLDGAMCQSYRQDRNKELKYQERKADLPVATLSAAAM